MTIKQKFVNGLWGLAILLLGTIIVLTVKFIDSYTFQFHSPIVFQESITLIPKSDVIVNIVQAAGEQNVTPLTPDQQYACNLFKTDCKTAIAIMRAESHYRNDAYNINSNGSVDLGCFQINTLWLKDINTTNINLFNCQQNTDVAYMIYVRDGNSFKDWVTYDTGTYKQYLIGN